MTQKIEVELFGQDTNIAVIRLPAREYPGILIQGDSFVDLLGSLEDATNMFETERAEAYEALKYVLDELKWRLEYYERVNK